MEQRTKAESKAERKSLKLGEKMKVIDELKAGKQVGDIREEFGISKTQVYKINKDKDVLQSSALSGSIPNKSKLTTNKAKHPDINRAVFDWFCSIRTLKKLVYPCPFLEH